MPLPPSAEVRAQSDHADRHDQRADDLQRLAAEVIDGEDGDHGEGEVDRADNDGLQQRGIGGHAHALEDVGRVVEHHVDADELLEDRQRDADEDDEARRRKTVCRSDVR